MKKYHVSVIGDQGYNIECEKIDFQKSTVHFWLKGEVILIAPIKRTVIKLIK